MVDIRVQKVHFAGQKIDEDQMEHEEIVSDVINTADFVWMRNDYTMDQPIKVGDLYYSSVENAYQAAKTKDINIKNQIRVSNPFGAREIGKSVELPDDWDTKRFFIMTSLLRLKFQANPDLALELVKTGDKKIEMINSRDSYWGVVYSDGMLGQGCHRKGQNHLGNILMSLREEFKFTLDYQPEPEVTEPSNKDFLQKIVPETTLLTPMVSLFDTVETLISYQFNLDEDDVFSLDEMFAEYAKITNALDKALSEVKHALKEEDKED